MSEATPDHVLLKSYYLLDGTQGGGILNDFRYVTKGGILQSMSLDYLDDSIDISDFGFIRRNDEMALNYNLFKMQSRTSSPLQADLDAARDLGIRGTPSLVVGTHLTRGARPFLELEELVDRLLDGAGDG